MAKLPASNVFAKKIKSARAKAAKIAAGAHPSGAWPRSDKGIKRGPLTPAQKARRAASRSIRKHADNEIEALGPLTAQAIAEIVAGLQKPHCKDCTEQCKGCASSRMRMTTGCCIPHTCGSARVWVGAERAALLCHARRPCRQTAAQDHANQWKAWNDADAKAKAAEANAEAN